jgi:hypothetical protein
MSLEALAEAIRDVGYWKWWTAELPDVFQLEFGGTQLYSPPPAGEPNRGMIALRFPSPVSVRWLSWPGAPADWQAQLHADKLQLPHVSHEHFSFGYGADLLADSDVELLHGDPTAPSAVQLAFRAGNIGCIVTGPELRLVDHGGVFALDEIPKRYAAWWDYWKEYWRRRETPDAWPKDYACEVTIPLKTT